jgi:hypothetical protein
MKGDDGKPLPRSYARPVQQHLISSIPGNGQRIDEKLLMKLEEKVKPKKMHKTVQEILNHQRSHSDGKDDVFVPDIKSGFPNHQPQRPSVIHPVPPKADPDARKRTFPFCDEAPNSKLFKNVPPEAHSKADVPKAAKLTKPNDYIEQLRQAQQKVKKDPDENSAPLDLSMKTTPSPNGFMMPKMEPKVERNHAVKQQQQSAFKSIEALSASAQVQLQPQALHPPSNCVFCRSR